MHNCNEPYSRRRRTLNFEHIQVRVKCGNTPFKILPYTPDNFRQLKQIIQTSLASMELIEDFSLIYYQGEDEIQISDDNDVLIAYKFAEKEFQNQLKLHISL